MELEKKKKKKHFCPLLDVMLWHDMAYVEIYVGQDLKKERSKYYV